MLEIKEYTAGDKALLEKMPQLKGTRHEVRQMVEETQQDQESGMCIGCFI